MSFINKKYIYGGLILLLVLFVSIMSGCSLFSAKVNVVVNADDSYSDKSSSAIVAIIDKKDDSVKYFEVPSSDNPKTIEIPYGNYAAEIICPFNNDGSYYKCGYGYDINCGFMNNSAETGFDLSKVEFGKGNIDDINKIGDNISKAIESPGSDVDKSVKTKYDTNLEEYNKKSEQLSAEQKKAEQEAAQKAKAAADSVSFGAVAGTYKYVDSSWPTTIVINSDGTGSLTFSHNSRSGSCTFKLERIDMDATTSSTFGSDCIEYRVNDCTWGSGSPGYMLFVPSQNAICNARADAGFHTSATFDQKDLEAFAPGQTKYSPNRFVKQ